MGAVFAVIVLFLASVVASATAFDELDDDVFNVMDYGATGDAQTDDSQAFIEAWEDACGAVVESPTVYVPEEGTFLLNPITFHGPCNASTITFLISGTIIAPESPGSWDRRDPSEWLGFKDINGLRIDGYGVVDGKGKGWWDQSCRYHPQLRECTKVAPTALKFLWCKMSSITNIKLINSSQTHILLRDCDSFRIDNVIIQSPGNTPNTDGIHLQASRNIVINNSQISSGDDCISIGDYTSNIEIGNVECGPGHGISIGSLGKRGNYVQVQNIRVTRTYFNGTTNGARIKTWQVGRGYVQDVSFENIRFNNVQNPIIIDQNYCSVRDACQEEVTGVHISNVIYRGVRGTSSTSIAINLNCSRSVPCSDITMESVHLTSAKPGKQVAAHCSNAYGQEFNIVPSSCLSHY